MSSPHASKQRRIGVVGSCCVAFIAMTVMGTSTVLAASDPAPRDFDEAAAQQPAPEAASDSRVIGRVTGVHGKVYAESPDGTRRRLVENGPIYPGDRLVTPRGAQLGVLSGDHYTGLNEDTELSFALTPGGAPEVNLVRGQVRVLEAGEGGAAASVSTPALQVAAASGDVEVYAFPEKAYLVSMVCALEGQVKAANIAGESATVAEGGCAISKPLEGVYAAGAAAAPLAPVGAAGPGGTPRSMSSPAGPPAQRFSSPSDVAFNLDVRSAPSFGQTDQLFMPCSGGTSIACGAGAGTNPGPNGPFPGPTPPGLPTRPVNLGPNGPFPGPTPPGLP